MHKLPVIARVAMFMEEMRMRTSSRVYSYKLNYLVSLRRNLAQSGAVIAVSENLVFSPPVQSGHDGRQNPPFASRRVQRKISADWLAERVGFGLSPDVVAT